MRDGGIGLLATDDRAAANDFFDQVGQYGIFAVRNGEMESWLTELGVQSKKAAWTVEMLQCLGSDPNDVAYVKPEADDVWAFVNVIVEWIKDPQRKGTD